MTLPASPPTAAARSSSPGGPARAWLHEPLLHFVLVGAALFAADALVARWRDDPHRIVVDAAVDREAVQVFTAARGHAPNNDELYALRRVWLDNEVLYREGLALQMDRGDQAIRDRVIFKALSALDAGLKLPPVNDTVLRTWFENNRSKYDEPPRISFSEAVLPEANPGEPAARAMAAQLNGSGSGDAGASLRVFTGRPLANIVQSYGADFSRALETAPPGEWRALRHGALWRVVRLESVSVAKPASFEPIRRTVMQDWTDAVMSDQRAAVVKTMAAKYTVVTEAAKP